jgi:zinc protease
MTRARLWIAAGLGLFASTTAFAQDAPARKWMKDFRLPVPARETLPNGLDVAWFVSDRVPLVDFAVLVKSGTRDDAQGKSGTAEMVSAMLDRGAGGKSAEQIARSIEKLGASRYVTANDDTFSIGVHGLSDDSETLLGILSDIVIRPDFPQAEFDKERSRMLARWEHIGDYGQTLASLAFHRIVASGSTYARGSLASIKEFEKVVRDDVVTFHKSQFTPKTRSS